MVSINPLPQEHPATSVAPDNAYPPLAVWRAEFFTSDLVGARKLADRLRCACLNGRCARLCALCASVEACTKYDDKSKLFVSTLQEGGGGSVGHVFFFWAPSILLNYIFLADEVTVSVD